MVDILNSSEGDCKKTVSEQGSNNLAWAGKIFGQRIIIFKI